MTTQRECEACEGYGKSENDEDCSECNGRGIVWIDAPPMTSSAPIPDPAGIPKPPEGYETWLDYALRPNDLHASWKLVEDANARAELKALRLSAVVKLTECPECAFGFDARHTNMDGGYTCPVCSETALRGRVAESEEKVRELNRRCQSAESGLARALEGAKGPSLGRALANSAATMYAKKLKDAEGRVAELATRAADLELMLRAFITPRGVDSNAPIGLNGGAHYETLRWVVGNAPDGAGMNGCADDGTGLPVLTDAARLALKGGSR